MDMCVEQTHDVTHEYRSNEKPLRYTDTRMDEQVLPRFCVSCRRRVPALAAADRAPVVS